MIKINCDMCGRIEESFNRAVVEGVELTVCKDCSRFGKVIGLIGKPAVTEKKRPRIQQDIEEKTELLAEDYAEIIKKKREAIGLTQKEFATKISEKESLVHKIETGVFQPQLDLARKIEKFLKIKIVEDYQETGGKQTRPKTAEFTIGDFIKTKEK